MTEEWKKHDVRVRSDRIFRFPRFSTRYPRSIYYRGNLKR